jgi:hypothetical protein
MQNFTLLNEIGTVRLPVLLKRGMSATIKEFLLSAEYILKQGNTNVILCERGIRTFETSTRNTLDLSSVPLLKTKTHLPVFVAHEQGGNGCRSGRCNGGGSFSARLRIERWEPVPGPGRIRYLYQRVAGFEGKTRIMIHHSAR